LSVIKASCSTAFLWYKFSAIKYRSVAGTSLSLYIEIKDSLIFFTLLSSRKRISNVQHMMQKSKKAIFTLFLRLKANFII
jgi:hypothetical protein